MTRSFPSVHFVLTSVAMLGFVAGMVSAVLPDDAPASASDAKFSAEEVRFYNEQVQPLLEQNCYDCHGKGKIKGGLRLTSRHAILEGGDSGAAVDFQQVDASPLMEAVNYESYEMPPSGKLPDEQIALIRRWIEKGLPMPETDEADPIAEKAHRSPQVDDDTRNHWSFLAVKRPSSPDVQHAEWVTNPIDAFVLARLEQAGLSPAPPAAKQALIRRVTYDLTGLPPSPDEVDAFVADESPDAYERLVERLLDSPHYGEHWARYWLDLVRYAESNSFERDNPKPFVWRYRDYVIKSLNDDKPYNRFIREQLAGDELDEPTPGSIIATGFYRLGIWDDEPADPLLAYYDGLDDIAATTSQALLGLTLNCARCHEHKLDPIPQHDYYRFVAFFGNIQHYGKRADDTVAAASLRDVVLPEETSLYAKQAADYGQQLSDIREQVSLLEAKVLPQLVGGEKDDFQDASSRLDILRRGIGRLIDEPDFKDYERLKKKLAKLEANPPRAASRVLSIKEHGAEAPPAHVLIRGNPHVEGAEVDPGFPSVLSPPDPAIRPPAHGESSGRRRALAEWIASPENPLTARVMANRIWQWHFGRGIVRSPNNFGLQGVAPTHPLLLDWLAAEFVGRGWSLKSMHRLILMSNTYRMASSVGEQGVGGGDQGAGTGEPATERGGRDRDPQNDLFWQFNMRRLRAEEVRDSILAVNGRLNTSKMFGPSIYPVIPPEVLAGQSRPGQGWGTSGDEDVRRRSIYIHLKRSLMVPILAAFDVAETDKTCPVRFATTQPTQALGMLNSTFISEQVNWFAAFLREHAGDDPPAQVRLALRRVTQREPTEAEISRGLQLIKVLETEHGRTPEESLHDFCLTALNLNEFLYLD